MTKNQKKAPKITISGNVFKMEIAPNTDMGKVQKFMDAVADATNKEEQRIAQQLKVSENTAGNIQYLRTRSRWTQELENKLIAADHAGKPINSGLVLSGEWPPDKSGSRRKAIEVSLDKMKRSFEKKAEKDKRAR